MAQLFGVWSRRNHRLGTGHSAWLAVMHGKTRRGALVFDIADIVKDAIVLPLAFICANDNASEQDFALRMLKLLYHL